MQLKQVFFALIVFVLQKHINAFAISDHRKDVANLVDEIRRHTVNIQKSIFILSSTKKVRDGPPVDPNEDCTIMKDDLESLKETINDALNNATDNDPDVTCEFDGGSSTDNCDELLKLIQCGILHMQDGIVDNSNSLSEAIKWKNAYNDLAASVKKQLDDLEQSLNEEHLKEMEKLKEQIQSLLAKIQQLTESLQNAVKPLVRKIANQQREDAWNDLKLMNDELLIRNTITATFYNTEYSSSYNESTMLIQYFLWGSPKDKWMAQSLNEYAKIVKHTEDIGYRTIYIYDFFIFLTNSRLSDFSESEIFTLANDFKLLLIRGVNTKDDEFFTAVFLLESGNFHKVQMAGVIEEWIEYQYRSDPVKIDQLMDYMISTNSDPDKVERGSMTLVEEMDKANYLKSNYNIVFNIYCKTMHKKPSPDNLKNILFQSSLSDETAQSLIDVATNDPRCRK